jgi:predicted nuclease of predicted toxin-antitoxin system
VFKIDENLPEEVAHVLIRAGFDTATVREQRLAGSPDPDIAAICSRERRTLVTQDHDFARDLVLRSLSHAGLILLRPHSADRSSLIRLTKAFAAQLPRQPLYGQIWVVREGSIRRRDARR